MLDLSPLKLPSPVQQLHSEFLQQHQIELYIKRDDLIHPVISGNKWRKLKYNLKQARQDQHSTLLTFGGAYSNHIHATAAAGRYFGFNTIGIIRGEPYSPLNPTLQDATDWGMQLDYVSRADYRQKTSAEFIHRLRQKFGDFYLIPEGGNNDLAVTGVSEIIEELDEDYDMICIDCGTGATMAGIIAGLRQPCHVLGFAVLKGADFLINDIRQRLQSCRSTSAHNWTVNLDYHFGGFAKTRPELFEFIDRFQQEYHIPLEPIYSGKMLYGVFDLIKKGQLKTGSRVLVIHSGGLQGARGMSTQHTTDTLNPV